MPSVQEVLDDVDGLRQDVAARIRQSFGTVNDLAAASTEELTQIKGVGEVLARRVRDTAAGALARAGELPQTAKGTTARAAASAEKAIDTVSATARNATDDATARARTTVHRLHARSDERVDATASTVGEAGARAKSLTEKGVGLAGAVVRMATAPARAALRRLRDR